jgi:glycosyltransferase involved in cell wall biosynthesis
MEKRGITDITCQDASLTAMVGVSLKRRSNGKTSNAVTLEIQVHEDIGSPNYSFNWTNKIRRFLALNYLPKADHIRVVSNRIKEFLIERLGPPAGGEDSKIEVRPIAVDTEAIKNAPIIASANLHKKYPQFDKVVLMAGRLEPEKNVELAIKTWPLVIEKHPKAGLIIVGDGSLKSRLERQAKGLKASAGEAIIFESWVDKPTLISYYKTADLFLNTSLFEGYGMALIEANAAKCKIVSTDVGIVGDTLKDGHNSTSVVDWNKQSVAGGIIKALNP